MEPWTIRILKLADELANKGHEIKILYFSMRPSPRGTFRNIPIIPINRTISLGSMLGNYKTLLGMARWADVVHIQKSHFYAVIPAVAAAYTANKPLHYDWDDWEEKIFYASIHRTTLSSVLTGFSFHLLERALPFMADSVSIASEALRNLAIRRGADRRRIAFAPVGADLVQFNPAVHRDVVRQKYKITTEALVLYHGQLHGCQYVRLFLRAIQIIEDRKAGAGLKFMVMGSGYDLGPLQAFAEEAGLKDRVIFTDFVPHGDVPSYIAAADICVAPFEDNEITRCKSPLKIVEYLASGKPVVASDVGEVRHMVDGVGLLVPPGSAEGMARGILELAEDEGRRQAMAAAARKRAEERYNWRVSAENIERVYAPVA
jgi:glycosyltransferase involved in cell wall biosynthesis